jgi:hypothetical protein
MMVSIESLDNTSHRYCYLNIGYFYTAFNLFGVIMSNAPGGYDGSPSGVDLDAFPAAAELVHTVGEFMKEVQHL